MQTAPASAPQQDQQYQYQRTLPESSGTASLTPAFPYNDCTGIPIEPGSTLPHVDR